MIIGKILHKYTQYGVFSSDIIFKGGTDGLGDAGGGGGGVLGVGGGVSGVGGGVSGVGGDGVLGGVSKVTGA
tara:strand:+ start:651 stop:866 length:216 start_codon:yes stop_codon:yes gene_type:complete